MTKLILSLLTLFLALSAYADILIIGDSHTAGPFGELLHKHLVKALPKRIVLTYGHSSSAPAHWMSNKPVMLSGGLNHHMGLDDIYLPHPNKPSWRIKQPSQNLITVLDNPVIHDSWKKRIPQTPEIRTIIFALGANDRNAVSMTNGKRTGLFEKRVQTLDKMLNEIENRGIDCIWIAPPGSPLSPKATQQTTHEYLLEGIKQRCPVYDSRKFVANFCDKVHFECPKGMEKAREWAREAADFVLSNL